jgi:hypothetical protein
VTWSAGRGEAQLFERTGEIRPPQKGETYLGHQGEIQYAAEDLKPESTNDHFEILRSISPKPGLSENGEREAPLD